MKLRFYLRGLGIGIIVTALIMGMTSEAGQPLSDAEIRALAENLGMVNPDTLRLTDVGSPAGNQPSMQPKNTNLPESSEEPGTGNDEEDSSPEVGNTAESPEPEDTVEPEEGVASSPLPEVTETPSPSPSPTTEVPDTESVTIVIVRGDSSYTVSRRLVEAGLIEDARGFDTFLVDNGYSKTIRTGTYKIPLGATWEEIARIIA